MYVYLIYNHSVLAPIHNYHVFLSFRWSRLTSIAETIKTSLVESFISRVAMGLKSFSIDTYFMTIIGRQCSAL